MISSRRQALRAGNAAGLSERGLWYFAYAVADDAARRTLLRDASAAGWGRGARTPGEVSEVLFGVPERWREVWRVGYARGRRVGIRRFVRDANAARIMEGLAIVGSVVAEPLGRLAGMLR